MGRLLVTRPVQRFSSVVGPNGSGKSNVIDAMLFVFGKRAAQMRLKKLPELIHKSDLHPDLEFAKVEVHFQEIIDYLVRHSPLGPRMREREEKVERGSIFFLLLLHCDVATKKPS
jgi:chromosome segregation ATPase